MSHKTPFLTRKYYIKVKYKNKNQWSYNFNLMNLLPGNH